MGTLEEQGVVKIYVGTLKGFTGPVCAYNDVTVLNISEIKKILN